MTRPRISIVIPAFNVAPYIRAALDSTLQQTEAPHEILVFDDGSMDGTDTILAEYADRSGVRFFSQKNMGPGRTRNHGARLARGDYLYFFDADDLLDTSFVARMQQLIMENDAPELIMFSGTGFTEHEDLVSFVKDFRRDGQARSMTGLEALPLLHINDWLHSAPWLYLTKASFWRDQGFAFPSTLNEDEDLIVPLILTARTVLIRDEILVRQRIRKDSITTGRHDFNYLRAMESNVHHASQQISLVPATAKRARKLLRKRCRIMATQYLAVAEELDVPVRKSLLLRASAKIGNGRLFRRALFGR